MLQRITLAVVVCGLLSAARAGAQSIAVTATPAAPNPAGQTFTYTVAARTRQNITIVGTSSAVKTPALTGANKIDVSWIWADGPVVKIADVTSLEVYRTITAADGSSTTVKLIAVGRDSATSLADTGITGDRSQLPSGSFLAPRVTPMPAPAAAAAKTVTYVIVARDATGALTPSEPGSADSSATFDQAHVNDVVWRDVPMSQSYDVYRTAGGGTTGRIATVAATGAATYQLRDTGLAADGTMPPDSPTRSAAVAEPSVAKLVDGARIVSGVKGAGARPHSISVTVRDGGEKKPGGDYLQRATSSTINDDGSFAVALQMPLVSGEQVQICARGGDDVDTASSCHYVTVETPDDWGRVRAYFAAGVVFSQKEDSFSQQDLALSFTLDKVWIMREKPVGFRPQAFNTFFDTRLTSVPVGTASTTTTSTPAAQTSSQDQFIASRKAALMQVGLYVPVYSEGMTWTHNGQKNAVFLAFPMARFGVVTTGGATTTLQTQAGGTTTTTTTAPIAADDGVYKFYGVGFGVGHEKLSGDSNTAPEVISYVHATFGKWENFSKSQWRMGFEGRLKIPMAPFQIGFEANLPFRSGPSDLRLLVGMRFDFGTLLGKLKQF